MSNENATDSRLFQAQKDNRVSLQAIDRYTSVPIEGQVAHSYATVTAGAVNNFYEFQYLVGGTALTLDAAAVRNFRGRNITFICNESPAAGTTLTLTGGLQFNNGIGAQTTCTFDPVNPSVIELVFGSNSTGATVVTIKSEYNTTIS